MLEIVRFLEDGGSHTLDELAEKTKVQVDELTKYCLEASKKGLLDYDPKTAKVQLAQNMMSALLKLNTQSKKKAQWKRKGAGTTIIPQNKGIRIQGLRIQNRTENDLKIEFTYKTAPEEIIISKA
jgi:hypothetical protein